MAKLTTAERKSMPQGEYALSGKRFPIPDANHARAAISGASRAENVGNISPTQKVEIDAKARAFLAHKLRGK